MTSVCFPPYRLDFKEQRLLRGAEEIPLRAKTFAVLCRLVENAGQLVTKEDLLAAVWPGAYVCDVAPGVCVWEIRKALERPGQTLVATVHRRGYRFVGRIAPAVEPARAAPEAMVAAVPWSFGLMAVPRRSRLCPECEGGGHPARLGSRRWRSTSRNRRDTAGRG